LKDRQFGRVQLFTPHKNPPAKIGNYLYSFGSHPHHLMLMIG